MFLISSSALQEAKTKSIDIHTTSTKSLIDSLPPPKYCSELFCNKIPTCITSYIPNPGVDLGSAIISNTSSPISMPRLGASHYANNPSFQIKNLENRFAPLGYRDRKFAYRLAYEPTNKKKKEDASTATMAFTMIESGPVVVCEPPCFIDECPPKRKMPLIDHVTLVLDGTQILDPSFGRISSPIEVGGKFCNVVSKSVAKGYHTLQISTNVTAPEHVMFSHVITFS
mmetsp:Transcript_23913/g.41983  ORF Transcript_23913/g.41983 Transcript_23913/m.41983 type:complete len:227 (-) Transcript_23913:27-707(-)